MSQETPADVVQYAASDGIATITLNRPERMNAMTVGLMRGLRESMERVVKDESVRVVVLTGAGRGFCGGADLTGVPGARPEDPGLPQDRLADDSDEGTGEFVSAMRAVMDCPVPTIARVNGAAAGGGFGLALACDIAVAARSAFFVATFGPRLGIVPDLGTTWSLPLRVGRARALGLTLLGDRISAEQAHTWGLIWSMVDDDQLDAEVDRIAGQLKNSSPSAMVRIRKTTDDAIHNTFSDQLDLEMRHQDVLVPRNMTEGARAFLEKREPKFSGERG